MSIHVFLGPSLSLERARALLDVEYLPPVQQGDVLRLLKKRPRAIGIIDGLFGAVPSVWHKEILLALEQGCHVVGASSMGALRAAELWTFGMRGVGTIFEQFRDGILEDDDEVAVAHASADHHYKSLSLAMVNIRDLLQQAEQAGVLMPDEARALEQSSKAMFYRDRSLQAVLEHAARLGLSEQRALGLSRFAKDFGPMAKERDAVAALAAIGELITADVAPYRAAHRVERTLFVRDLLADVAGRSPPRRSFDDIESRELTGLPLWALRKEALIQILAREMRQRLGIDVATDEVESAWQQLRRRADLSDTRREHDWLERHQLSEAAASARLGDIFAVHRVEAAFSAQVERELPDLVAVLSAIRGT